MSNLFNLSEEEKNRIRGLHLTESKDLRLTSVLTEAIPGSESCMHVEFECGESTINPEDITINLENYLRPGWEYDGKFGEIEVGVSGPGNVDDNKDVLNARVDAVYKMLMNATTWEAPEGTEYIEEYLRENIPPKPKYGTTETSSVLRSRSRAPEDPCDEYYKEFQFIELCFDELKPIPEFHVLADQLKGAIKGWGTHLGTIKGIISEMRGKSDWITFNELLEKHDWSEEGKPLGMDFYDAACYRGKGTDWNPLVKGRTYGVSELDSDEAADINYILDKAGFDCIKCKISEDGQKVISARGKC